MLATMVARGFDKTATKEDLYEFKKEVNTQFNELEGKLEKLILRFGIVSLVSTKHGCRI